VKRIGLSLSGGGIRAVAHLGVVEVLGNAGIEAEMVAGSSGGALVGALLCDGKSPRQILSLIDEIRLWDLFRGSGRGGLFALEKLEEILREHLSVANIEDLQTDFTVACTDLAGGEVHYFDKGPVAELCIASSSLVPIFSPVRYGDLLLADGGFMDNMPVRPLLECGLPVLGVNVNPILPRKPDSLVRTTARALVLMMAANIEASRSLADFYIEPVDCAAINIFDLTKAKEAYEAGKRAAESALPKLIDTFSAL
jgi:NTE family protein